MEVSILPHEANTVLGRGVRSVKFLTPTPLLLRLNYTLTPIHFKVLDSDSCFNSKVNYLKAVAIDTPVDLEI